MNFGVVLVVCIGLLVPLEAAKILAVFHMPIKSHHIIGSSLLIGLAARGHQVTMMSPFPATREPLANYTDIYLDGMTGLANDMRTYFIDNNNNNNITFSMKLNFTNKLTDMTLRSDGMQKLLASDQLFDLVILMSCGSEALFGLGHRFQAPIIGFSPTLNQLVNHIAGNTAPYSFVPNLFTAYSDHMTFVERVINTLLGFGMHCYWILAMLPGQRKQYETYFPEAPDFNEAIKNVSLFLVNTHVIFETPRPYLPSMIQVGGLQINEPKQLPQDLQKFLDRAKEGVIYFSLGSNIRSIDLPEEKRNAIMKTFAKLPYKVLWKFEDENLGGKLDNLKIGEWFPQSDVLAHPNVKLFITHGGLLSTTEAVHRGVPVLGIPFYGDQMANVASFVKSGYGLRLLFEELTEETFTEAIQEIMNNQKYHNKVKKISSILKDQPMTPLDTAVYWTEYIIRHNGGQHLRSASVDLSLFQYLLLDVIGFIALVLGTFIVGMYLIMRRICCSKTRHINIQRKMKSKQT